MSIKPTTPHLYATELKGLARLEFLPTYFGKYALQGENFVYVWARRLCPDYTGGLWNFYKLRNGGCYLAPSSGEFHTQCSLNGFEETLNADAFGIVVTLFALYELCERCDCESFANLYHLLRNYIPMHSDAASIWRAID